MIFSKDNETSSKNRIFKYSHPLNLKSDDDENIYLDSDSNSNNEEILNEYDNLIVVKSISKSYGVPGLRLGVLASSNADYINMIKKTNAIWNINSFGEYYLQIYEKYSKTYSSACDSIAEERARFTKELSKIKHLHVFPSQANFILCRLDGDNRSDKLAVTLMEKYNIFIKDLTGKKCFDEPKYIRLAVRNAQDNNELIEAMRECIK